jgi:uncharacterized membrane protein YhaH (DUF805 family)
MRGDVLKPVEADGPGLILGEDGARYTFTPARVHKGAVLAPGAAVDFIPLGSEARDIYPLAAASPAPAPAAATAPAATKADKPFSYFLRGLWKNYARFQGRARRTEYFGYNLFWTLILIVLLFADGLISTLYFGMYAGNEEAFTPILSFIYYILTLVPGISITVRRLHDQNTSGWFYLITFVPYIGGIILLIVMFRDSRRESNKHGPSPKYGAAQTADVFG